MKLEKVITPEIFQVDRKLHHSICLAEYEKSFDFRSLNDKYKFNQLRRLNDVFQYIEIGDETIPQVKRSIDSFDLINPYKAKQLINACYEVLGGKFCTPRAVNCLKAIDRYCQYLKQSPYIHQAGQKVIYIPDLYGSIESPINRYTIPLNKPSDATKHYLTESEYKTFLTFLWKKWDSAHKNDSLEASNQLFFICVVAGELGLRLQEILGLELRHIDLIENTCLVVKGKGSNGSGFRKRETQLSSFFKASLNDFLKAFPRSSNEAMFQNYKGENLSNSTAYKWLKKTIDEIQALGFPIVFEKGFGFHAFRRTYARFFIEKDGDFMQLMKNTGWKFASTASHYIGASKHPINYLGD